MQSPAGSPDHSTPINDDVDTTLRYHSLFSEEELVKWAGACKAFDTLKPPFALSMLVHFVNMDQLNSQLNAQLNRDPPLLVELTLETAHRLLDENPWLGELILANKFRHVICSNVLLAKHQSEVRYVPLDAGMKQAIETSWHTPFRGSTNSLKVTLEAYMKDECIYARYLSYTQSSGTGKSRMIDQLAKTVLCIPVNLSPPDADAFPPSDTVATQWLTVFPVTEQDVYAVQAASFLYAIFSTAHEFLEDLVTKSSINLDDLNGPERVARLAQLFRIKMNEDMQFGAHGKYHQSFYDAVDKKAKKFQNDMRGRKEKSPRMSITDDERKVISAADALLKYLSPEPSSESEPLPLVIMSFDEAFKLVEPVKGSTWTRFSALIRVLRLLVEKPIFTIFLSTVGKLEQFAPLPELSPSSRIAMRQLQVLPPIVSTTFDILSRKLSFEPGNECTLRQVASTYHMAHLGRPLFAAAYDAGPQELRQDILSFASSKLLQTQQGNPNLTIPQMLAGVGVRIPFELRLMSTAGAAVERTLISNHLRLLLFADVGFTRAVTACASEPLLAEASYKEGIAGRWAGGEPAIQRAGIRVESVNPILAISRISRDIDVNVDLGIHGEIVAALLLLDARDRATTIPTTDGAFPGDSDQPEAGGDGDPLACDGALKRRIVTVQQFLKALIPDASHQPCFNNLPTSYLAEHKDTSLSGAFEDAHIYFNHFVKVASFDVVNQSFLLGAISRGAAYICADNQAAYDILIPILFGTVLKVKRVSAILVQVKNSKGYRAKIYRSVFATMNPFTTGVFGKGVEGPPPVIRIVFALASEKCGVYVPMRADGSSPRRKLAKTDASKFTAYDLWFAGATRQTFGVIQDEGEERSFEDLRKKVRDQRDVFKMYRYGNGAVQEEMENMIGRSMQPLISTEKAHYMNFITDDDVQAPVDLADDELSEQHDSSCTTSIASVDAKAAAL